MRGSEKPRERHPALTGTPNQLHKELVKVRKKKRLHEQWHREQGTGEVTRQETVAQVPRPDLGVSGSKPETHLGLRDQSATQGTELASDSISGSGGGKTRGSPKGSHSNIRTAGSRDARTPQGNYQRGLPGVSAVGSRARSSGEGRTAATTPEHAKPMVEVNAWAGIPRTESWLLPGQRR
ncbi:hypothetical protein NDU88_006575 [Pleurodeles waltl]|uniref:Uncharacterized protein n=1 Tax=Pleurodeles waltl TaxID=8319 RepID=A0AAV7NUU2_PLEWA|nr:hypothetical protein NDU88_006575 [Pleurodeles waltl]